MDAVFSNAAVSNSFLSSVLEALLAETAVVAVNGLARSLLMVRKLDSGFGSFFKLFRCYFVALSLYSVLRVKILCLRVLILFAAVGEFDFRPRVLPIMFEV